MTSHETSGVGTAGILTCWALSRSSKSWLLSVPLHGMKIPGMGLVMHLVLTWIFVRWTFFSLSLPDGTPVARHCCSVLVPGTFPSLKNISNASKPPSRWCYITPKTYAWPKSEVHKMNDLSRSPYVLNSTKIFHYKYCFYSFLIKKKNALRGLWISKSSRSKISSAVWIIGMLKNKNKSFPCYKILAMFLSLYNSERLNFSKKEFGEFCSKPENSSKMKSLIILKVSF